MAQAVVRPACKFCSRAHMSKLASCTCGNHAARHSAVRLKPCREAWLYRHNSSACTLCLCRLYLDVSAREIDFAPIQSLNLSLTNPANAPMATIGRTSGLMRFADSNTARNSSTLKISGGRSTSFGFAVREDRISFYDSPAVGVAEQHPDDRSVVCSALRGIRERS